MSIFSISKTHAALVGIGALLGAVGIANIRMAFDCDVVLGGFMAPRLSFYFDFVVRRAGQLDFLRTDASFLRYARHPHHGVPLGAAQKMVQRYIEQL